MLGTALRVMGVFCGLLAAVAGPAAADARKDLAAEFLSVADEINSANFNLQQFLAEVSALEADALELRLQEHLTTQIYAGVLRGGEGALAAGGGNAWDQALLAQAAFEAAGLETRLMRSNLSPGEAADLIAAASAGTRRPLEGSAGLMEAVNRLRARYGQVPMDEEDWGRLSQTDPLPALPEVDATATALRAALGADFPDVSDLSADYMAMARDYVWLQTRTPGTENWTDRHIAFEPRAPISGKAVPGNAPGAEDMHRLRLRITAETPGRDSSPIEMLGSTEFVVASRSRRPIDLSLVVQGGDETPKLQALLDQQPGPASGTIPITSVKKPSTGLGGLFSNQAGGLGGLNSTIGGSTPEPEKAGPVTVWLDISYLPPAGSPARDFRREMAAFDPKGPVPPIIAQLSLDIVTKVRGAEETLHWVMQTLGNALLGEDTGGPGRIDVLFAPYLAGLVDAQNTSAAASYHLAPQLSLNGWRIDQDGRLDYQTDILQSGRIGLRSAGDGWTPDPEVGLRAGISETIFESVLIESISTAVGSSSFNSAWAQLETAGAAGSLQAGPSDDNDGQASDAENRNLLVTAAGDPEIWWRIDSQTGVATGVYDGGRGGAELTLPPMSPPGYAGREADLFADLPGKTAPSRHAPADPPIEVADFTFKVIDIETDLVVLSVAVSDFALMLNDALECRSQSLSNLPGDEPWDDFKFVAFEGGFLVVSLAVATKIAKRFKGSPAHVLTGASLLTGLTTFLVGFVIEAGDWDWDCG